MESTKKEIIQLPDESGFRLRYACARSFRILKDHRMKKKQSFSLLQIPMLLATAVTGNIALAADSSHETMMCDQLGREIALRAAEQMGSFDADSRTTLAAIARQACLDHHGTSAMSMQQAGPAAAAMAPAAVVVDEPAADETGEAEGLFDVEIIDPQERVRRPGLKRR